MNGIVTAMSVSRHWSLVISILLNILMYAIVINIVIDPLLDQRLLVHDAKKRNKKVRDAGFPFRQMDLEWSYQGRYEAGP